MKYNIGETIRWMAINGAKTGRIEAKDEKGYLVRLGNGKVVYVHEKSINPF